MKIGEIYHILDEIAPFEFQEKWDNSGLLVGCMEDEFEKVYVALDIDSTTLKTIESNSLLIVHHPLIFDGLKSLDPKKYPSNLIYEMIKKDIKLIAMHTSADKAFLNCYLCEEVLGYNITSSDEFIVYFEVDTSFEELVFEVSKKLKLDCTKVVKTKQYIKTAALCSGSGGSLISEVNADCFLTGDIKYHTAFEAKENNLSLIDIEHYQSEVIFAKALTNLLKDKGINAIIAEISNPFTTYQKDI